MGEKEEAEEREETEENGADDIKLLQDSATALKLSNPQLADALTKCTARETEEGKMFV